MKASPRARKPPWHSTAGACETRERRCAGEDQAQADIALDLAVAVVAANQPVERAFSAGSQPEFLREGLGLEAGIVAQIAATEEGRIEERCVEIEQAVDVGGRARQLGTAKVRIDHPRKQR